MEKAGQSVSEKPELPFMRDRLRMAKLILEEAFETVEALGFETFITKPGVPHEVVTYEKILFMSTWENPRPGSPEETEKLVEIEDGCCDLRYVATCCSLGCGAPVTTTQDIVDSNNLEKFGPGHSHNEAGKLIKPPGFEGPEKKLFETLKKAQ